MICAATWSRTRAAACDRRARRRRAPPARACGRPALVHQSRREARSAAQLRARSARARAVIACGVPSACIGRPTTSSPRLPFVDQRARSRRSARRRARRRSSSADARRACSVLPTATPMRRVPKSNASTVASGRDARSRVTRARRRRTAARSRCRAAASRRAAAASAGRSNSTSASASTVSQAFCASSCSSWPADHPA